jgi:hypothetical protein
MEEPIMETVYIESSVLSYLVSRPSRDLIVAARQQITREWWEESKSGFECLVSQVVLDEIAEGNPEVAERRLEEARPMALLALDPSCVELARTFLERRLIPPGEVRDALHIAVAVIWKVDYLLTWNCKHIANAHAVRQLRKYTEKLGHEFPHICTPEEL